MAMTGPNPRPTPSHRERKCLALSDLSWSRQTDSNRRPADYKSAALPTELCRHVLWKSASFENFKSAIVSPFCIPSKKRGAKWEHQRGIRPRCRGSLLCAFSTTRQGDSWPLVFPDRPTPLVCDRSARPPRRAGSDFRTSGETLVTLSISASGAPALSRGIRAEQACRSLCGAPSVRTFGIIGSVAP